MRLLPFLLLALFLLALPASASNNSTNANQPQLIVCPCN